MQRNLMYREDKEKERCNELEDGDVTFGNLCMNVFNQ